MRSTGGAEPSELSLTSVAEACGTLTSSPWPASTTSRLQIHRQT